MSNFDEQFSFHATEVLRFRPQSPDFLAFIVYVQGTVVGIPNNKETVFYKVFLGYIRLTMLIILTELLQLIRQSCGLTTARIIQRMIQRIFKCYLWYLRQISLSLGEIVLQVV